MTAGVVIVNWNTGRFLQTCVESLFQTAPTAEVVVVDNASTDGSLELIDSFRDRIHIVRNSANLGFAAGVNQGFASTTSPYVLILNPDIRVQPDAVSLLMKILSGNSKAGAIGGYVNDDYLPRPFPGVASLIRENLGFRRKPVNSAVPGLVDQPAAAALMVRRDAFEEIGGFDEQFFPAWYEDVDFCRRLKSAGWDIYFAPDAQFEHEGGYSAAALGPKAFAEAYYHNQIRYAQKHLGGWGRLAVRISIVAGMLARMVLRPRNAGAYAGVIFGALGGW